MISPGHDYEYLRDRLRGVWELKQIPLSRHNLQAASTSTDRSEHLG